jgi:hypothetical protein
MLIGSCLVVDELDEVAERDIDVEDVQSERWVLQPRQQRPMVGGATDVRNLEPGRVPG